MPRQPHPAGPHIIGVFGTAERSAVGNGCRKTALLVPALALAAAATEGRFEGEGCYVRRDGTRFWANVIIDPIRNPAGELVGYAKITRDLTERRDTQLSLERTRELLFQSQKMEAVGQLTGGIAHDFNNLLAVIIGSLDIARRRATDKSVIRLIGNALSGAERGAALTQRMLVFARRQELKISAGGYRGARPRYG